MEKTYQTMKEYGEKFEGVNDLRDDYPLVGQAALVETEPKQAYAMMMADLITTARFEISDFTGALSEGLSLQIDKLVPVKMIENRPARVYFTLWNKTKDVINGYVRAQIQPRQDLDPYQGNFDFEIKNLAPRRFVSGVITFIAPRADTENGLKLMFFTRLPPQGEVFLPDKLEVETEKLFDVAARFSLTVDRITIRETASPNNDTLSMNVSGTNGEIIHSESKFLGDHDNGTFPVEFKPVGFFDLYPGESTGVNLTYLIANAGHTATADQVRNALDKLSDIGAAIATAVFSAIYPSLSTVWEKISEVVNQFHHWINEWVTENCDTVVVLDSKLFTTDELFLNTFDPEDQKVIHTFPPKSYLKSKGERLVEFLGGGCRPSDYRVTCSIHRYRNPDEIASLHSQDGIRLAFGQEVNIVYITRPEERVTWKWQVEGEGKIDPHGRYRAPARLTLDSRFDIITGKGYVEGTNGLEEKYSGFTVILFD